MIFSFIMRRPKLLLTGKGVDSQGEGHKFDIWGVQLVDCDHEELDYLSSLLVILLFDAWGLVKYGPLAVGINAVFMQTYIGGVSFPYICSRRLDHGVLHVGYGAEAYAPLRLKQKPYWIIKNSWGEGWGEKGYYKICRGRNVCGVDSMVSAVAAIHVLQNHGLLNE